MNKVILIGNLARDPEIRTTNQDKKIASLRLITSTKRGGREYSEGHTVSVYNVGLAGLLEKYSKKGDKIMITGQLRNTRWESNGETKYGYEVAVGPNDELEFLGSPRRSDEPSNEHGDYNPGDDIPY